MKRSNRLVLLIGIFLALIAFVLIAFSGVFTPKTVAPSASPTTAKVVVAARNVALGATFAETDVTYKDVPLPPPADSYADTSFVVGQIARASVTAGQLINSAVIIGGEGQVANIEVPPGRVAMSVKVDQVSGVGTVIKTGDYVDALVAFNIKPLTIDPATGEPKALDVDTGPSVKVLLQGLQVLGTLLPAPGQAQQPAEGASPAPSGATTTNLNGQEQIVILSVSAQQAEVLNYSQIAGAQVSNGNSPNGMTLLLRSSKDFVGPDGQPSLPAGHDHDRDRPQDPDRPVRRASAQLLAHAAAAPLAHHEALAGPRSASARQRAATGPGPVARTPDPARGSRSLINRRNPTKAPEVGPTLHGRPDPRSHRRRHPGDPRSPLEAAQLRDGHRGRGGGGIRA